MRVEDFERMRLIVQKFGAEGGEGEKLQEMLKEFAENQDCWVSERTKQDHFFVLTVTRAHSVCFQAYDMWLEDMYMRNPLALPVNSNPGMVFPRHLSSDFVDARKQLTFAAKLISGVLDYKAALDTYTVVYFFPIETRISLYPFMKTYWHIHGRPSTFGLA